MTNETLEQRVDKITTFRKSLKDFSRDCLGYKDMNNIHDDLCDLLQNEKVKFKLILMPRFSFKSCICTIGYSLWRLMADNNLRVLIYSDAANKAVGFLNEIKGHIEGKIERSEFRKYMPEWETDPRSGKWSESQILVSVRKTNFKEPTIDTGGVGTSKVGMHYDIIIFDDIVSDVNVTTKDQMDKVADCYKRSLSLLKPGGEVIIVGTRWHFADLYGRIIAENEKNNIFKIFVLDGEDDKKYGEFCFKDIGLSKEFLDHQKGQQGSYIHSCIYRNNPVDADTAIFKSRDFRFYGDIKTEDLYLTCTIDPAGEGKDFTAFTVVGTDSEMNMNVFEVVQKKLKPSEILNTLVNLHYKYKFKIVGIETIFFRKMLRLELERIRQEKHTENPKTFPMFGIHEFDSSSRQGKGKFARIMALQPYHERGAIKFPGEKLELLKDGFALVAHQMLEFTPTHMPEPNDALDSLADHIPLIRKGGLVKKQEVPYRSPAWLERIALEQELAHRRRMPVRLRGGYIAPLSFS